MSALSLGIVSQQAMIMAAMSGPGDSGVTDPGGTIDALFGNVGFLLEGEGADGSTTFTDRSQFRETVTGFGAAENDTAVDVAGTPAILLNGDANYVERNHRFGVLDLNLTSPDFCFEFHVNLTSLTGIQTFLSRRFSSGQFSILISSGNLQLITFNGSSGTTRLSVAHGMAINTTYHLCVIRSGSTYYAFRDGTLLGSNTSGSGSITQNTTGLRIGVEATAGRFVRGRMNHIRMTLGATRYSLSGFTPDAPPYGKSIDQTKASTPAATYANVSFLAGFNGANGSTSANDERSSTALSFGGSAELSTAQKAYGTASLLLDGSTSDFVTAAAYDADHFPIAGQDYTLETWIRPASLTGKQAICGGRDSSLADEMALFLQDDIVTFETYNAAAVQVGLRAGRFPVQLNKWVHIAVTRASGIWRLFVSGFLACEWYQKGDPSQNGVSPLTIGSDASVTVAGRTFFTGYIDEFRITNGEAVYTEPFIIPASAFPRS